MKKVLCIVLCLMFVMSNITAAFASETDYENNWAKTEIEYMKNRGIVSGYPDGSFKPANNMSKAEFYKVINKIMGYTHKTEINFNDVVQDNWYYDEVAKGVAAKYIIPAASLNAGENINRGEVARIIGIVFSIVGDKQYADFTDNDTIPEELKAVIGGLKKNGFINGYPDGSFRVNAEITRAEVVKMLHNIAGEIVNDEGLVSENADKNLVVNTADVTLKDMEIGGNLYLAEGIGEGEVFLENVKVKNSTIVNGGGANSVNIKNSELNSALLDKKQNLLNVVLSNTKIDTLKNANQIRLQLNQVSSIKNVELKDKAQLDLEKGSLIEKLIITGGDISINCQGSINYIKSAVNFKTNTEEAKANTEYKMADGKLSLLNSTSQTSSGGYVAQPTPTVNKAELASKIKEAQGKIKDDYTIESWEIFDKALQEAITVNNNTNTTQAKVNEALENLKIAMYGLEKKEDPTPAVNKAELEAKIKAAQKKIEADYTAESWLIFVQARQAAINVYNNAEASQAEVDEALANLISAIEGLEVKQETEYTDIENIMPNEDVTLSVGDTLNVSFNGPAEGTAYFRLFIKDITPMSNGSNSKINMTEQSLGYYVGSWTVTGSAISSGDLGIEVNLEKGGERMCEIAEGIVHIVQKTNVNKTELIAAIAEALTKLEAEYTPESWAIFAQALHSATVVRDNNDAAQSEVDEALENLTIAMGALVKKPVGPTPTIVAKYEPTFVEYFPFIHVSVKNLQDANKFSIVHYILDKNGNPKLTESDIFDISQKTGVIYYNPSKFESFNVNIYDQDINLIYTFENVIPVLYDETTPEVDKTALEAAIAVALTKNEADYTPESWAVFAQARQAAVAVNDNANATQNEVNTALTNLTNAMNDLVEKPSIPPTIAAKYYPIAFSNSVSVSISISNLDGAVMFDIIFNYSDEPDGTQNIGTSSKASINSRSEAIWYNPASKYKTITIRIYDINDNIIHIFENVTPVKGN